MKHEARRIRNQSGIALIALLVLLIMAGAYAFYRSTNANLGRAQQDQKLLLQLAQAKEALIAYAVTDNKRPGRLLCPDLIGNGISPLLSRDDCDAYVGWLPWKTLDLVDGSDDRGLQLRYVVSPLFGGDRKLPPLNSETTTSLRLDVRAGSDSNDIAGLIIATRGALDARNADGDDYFYSGQFDDPDNKELPSDLINDVIIAVTRQELMAAVEKRVANEVKACLEGHAASTDNTSHTYPWPAPLSNSIFKGVTGSLFGMIPATQPGISPDEVLKKSNSDLQAAKISLESASTATGQLAAVRKINDVAAYARVLYDRIYIAAADLEAKANAASNQFKILDNALVATTTTTLASVPGAVTSALPGLSAFRESLANLGLDPFLIELQLQNTILKAKIDAVVATPSNSTLGALQAQLNVFANKLFAYSFTPNPDLANLLNTGLIGATSAANAAKVAKNSPADLTLTNQAIVSATAVFDANPVFYSTVLANRVNVDGNEVSFNAGRIATALASFAQNPGAESAAALIPVLEPSRTLVAAISTASSTVLVARSNSLSALDNVLAATRAASDFSLIQSTTAATASGLNTLAAALLNNGDNIARESLKDAAATLTAAGQTAPATRTAARALRSPVKAIIYWADASAAQSADIARLARKTTWASGDSDTSAYTASRKLLDSIDGSTGTASALEAYIKNPGDSAKQVAAQSALANTQTLVADTLNTAGKLESLLETSQADAAVPTVWYSTTCSIMQPDSWWVANQWAGLVFYQISDRIRPATGKLTVNGSGTYPVVVIAAGRALLSQNRATRTTANFLEGKNADPWRDGDPLAPVAVTFANAPPSATFNDRLAY